MHLDLIKRHSYKYSIIIKEVQIYSEKNVEIVVLSQSKVDLDTVLSAVEQTIATFISLTFDIIIFYYVLCDPDCLNHLLHILYVDVLPIDANVPLRSTKLILLVGRFL